jgi:mannose-6-phosphate isomerase-like protein (cupin superfamily)
VAQIREDEFEVRPADVTWVPAGVAHRFASRSETALGIYWVVYAGRDVTHTITATVDLPAPVGGGPRPRRAER